MDTGVNGVFNRSHALIMEENGEQWNWKDETQLEECQSNCSQIYIFRVIKTVVFFRHNLIVQKSSEFLNSHYCVIITIVILHIVIANNTEE